ncbi:MAG: radical SAM protein [Deltaproteobacteria bacterium]|nr:radical SAM protein [Deltaproteobacteria bacterium]
MSLTPRFQTEKQKTFDSFLEFANGGEGPKWPQEIYLELSNTCNLKCAMCAEFSALNPYRYLRMDSSKRGFMKVSEVQPSLERLLPHVLWVHAYGIGEPTIHPHFCSFLDFLSQFEVLIDFYTNGMGLTEKLCEFLVSRRIFRVTISFSGSNQSDYENVYRGGSFERVLKGMALLTKTKQRHGSPYPALLVNSIGFQHHIDSLVPFVEMMASHGAEHIALTRLKGYVTIPQLHSHIAILRPWKEGEILQKAKSRADELGVYLDTSVFERTAVASNDEVDSARQGCIYGGPHSTDKVPIERFQELETYIKPVRSKVPAFVVTKGVKIFRQLRSFDGIRNLLRKVPSHVQRHFKLSSILANGAQGKSISEERVVDPPCLEPFLTMYFYKNLDARPCCFSQRQESFGNLSRCSGERIWNGPRFKATRENIIRGKYPSICFPCLDTNSHPFRHGVQEKYSTYSQWFERGFGTPFYPEAGDQITNIPDNRTILQRRGGTLEQFMPNDLRELNL